MRGLLFGIALVLFVTIAKAGIPPDATGLCNDGTYSTSATEAAACSAHGGVKAWFNTNPNNSAPAPTNQAADHAQLSAPPNVMSGNWEIQEETDPLDNSREYAAGTNADNKVANIIGSNEKPRLMLGCGRQGFIVDLHWPDWIDKEIDDSSVTVQWKLDDGDIQSANWDAIDQAVALRGEVGKAWMNRIANGHRLIIRVPDKHGGQDAIFTLDGLAKIAQAIDARDCGG